MSARIWRLLRDPLGVVGRRLGALPRRLLWSLGHSAPGGDRAEEFWNDIYCRYGFDLRGVGCVCISHEENVQAYHHAKKVFLDLCRREGLDLGSARIVDIGCGTGFYAQALLENGARDYLGIDISDVLFEELREMFPGCKFQKLDVTCQELDGQFDLVIMIDVAQHIVNQRSFSFAMQNVRSHLSKGGLFIVTSWLSKKVVRRGFYEVERPIAHYQRAFPQTGYAFGKPIPFRDKFMLSIRKTAED